MGSTKILDPKRDALLGALDAGAVALTLTLPMQDNRQNWNQIHVRRRAGCRARPQLGARELYRYDAKDDSIILSSRHQGVVKMVVISK